MRLNIRNCGPSYQETAIEPEQVDFRASIAMPFATAPAVCTEDEVLVRT